ncbi:peptidoglycan endopeptidase [Sphingomonas flavescens]|uniref:peptidoglycan endopeptidase n=1 Tax=Sphingomonas flavescens TaxID=3132797 RepID=UPI002803807A|nr:peptidoglycan endopeptidase [Sphingomonas limnosediminicola]
MTIDYAARAQALVGARFRPQGRGAEGFDCIGVVAAAFSIPAGQVRADYSLRAQDLSKVKAGLLHQFRRVGADAMQPGDVLLLQPGSRQFHLAVRTARGFVHAHAALRRVVEVPGLPEWPLLGVFRKRRR